MNERITASVRQGADSVGDARDSLERSVDRDPRVQQVLRYGWVAKGVVYILMGATAQAIGRQENTDDAASPEGALGQLREATGGRVLLGVLAAGLALYAVWRIVGAVIDHAHGAKETAERIGHAIAGVVYAALAVTAARAALESTRPEDSGTVERASSAALENPFGRGLLLVVGVVVLGLGIYFVVQQGLRKKFLEDFSLGDASESERKVVVGTGVAGWVGRGIVTSLVGFFVARAAWQFDESDARGFDRSLREVALDQPGATIVVLAGLGLIAYGVHCIVTMRRRSIRE